MDQAVLDLIPITVGRKDDGRWWADIECIPGAMAYGETRESAIAGVCALALRVVAECAERGEQLTALSEQLAAHLDKRAARASDAKFRAALDLVPDVEPDDHDRL